jgi:hypothetical protein
MLTKIGMMMVVIGACSGASESIVAPIVLMAAGVLLMWKGDNNGEENR